MTSEGLIFLVFQWGCGKICEIRQNRPRNVQKSDFLAISGSVLSDFAIFPASPLKYEKNAAFGSHVALSVLQIQLTGQGKSSSVHHYESGRNSSLFSLPCFLFYFLGDFWSETTQGTSMGRARIHFRGSWPIQGPFQPKFWLFDQKKVFTEMLISPEPDVPQGWLRCQNDRWTKGYAHDHSD